MSSAELYDPASGTWTATGSLSTARDGHTATLLPSGKVLVAGGYNGSDLSSAELFDVGLGFDPNWQPLVTTVSPSILPNGSPLTASGSRFQGISEASGGNGVQNSSSNYPLVQLLSLANEQTLFLPVDAMTGWSDSSFTSTAITLMTTSSSGFAIGYALVTVFTNGIPSESQFVLAEAPTPTPTPTPTATATATPTATATATATPTATATVTPTPPPQITLRAAGRKVNGVDTVLLLWSGATSSQVDIYRCVQQLNGCNPVVIATTTNDGRYTDSTGHTGHAGFRYKVCEAGTQTCSKAAGVTFER